MGQKVHPTGVRVGVIKNWDSKWYADSKNFGDYLVEDYNIRKVLKKKLYISEIYANQGPTLKRIRPAAKGSAVRIRKRTSHITIVLKEK